MTKQLSFAQKFGLGILLVWLVLPMLPLFVWSVARSWYFPHLIPPQWTLTTWGYVFSDASGVLDSITDTLIVSLGATALAVLIGVPAGRALGLYQFKSKRLVEIFILAPTIVPGIAVALGIHFVSIRIGLANTLLGVTLVHLIPTLPYMVLVMAGVFANYDRSYEDQARTLGASALQSYWYVMLPAILPGIIVGALFSFIVSWSQYILTLLIGGGRVITLPLLLFNFATAGRNDIAGAIGMLYIIPGVIVLILSARYLTGQSGIATLGRA